VQIQSHKAVKTIFLITFASLQALHRSLFLLKEEYLDNRTRADENVLRLHVPMDDAIGVQIIQRFYLEAACISQLRKINATAGTSK
jgi:hypothetical protein